MALSKIEVIVKMCLTILQAGVYDVIDQQILIQAFSKDLVEELGRTDVRALGQKLFGWEGSPPLGIRKILVENQDGRAHWDESRVLEKSVARNWWVHGSFCRWKYVIWSCPGEDDEEHFRSALFT